jgi:hypothetical protein
VAVNLSDEGHIMLWKKIINIVAMLADKFDQKWQKRQGILFSLLIILFIFQLVFFSKNKPSYGITIAELCDYCHEINIQLPQKKPVPAFCIL